MEMTIKDIVFYFLHFYIFKYKDKKIFSVEHVLHASHNSKSAFEILHK